MVYIQFLRKCTRVNPVVQMTYQIQIERQNHTIWEHNNSKPYNDHPDIIGSQIASDGCYNDQYNHINACLGYQFEGFQEECMQKLFFVFPNFIYLNISNKYSFACHRLYTHRHLN